MGAAPSTAARSLSLPDQGLDVLGIGEGLLAKISDLEEAKGS